MGHKNIQLGLKENWKQFTLLFIVNAFVGGMIGLERTILPELAEKEFEKFRTSQFAGMPALVLETEDKHILLTSGYTNFENIKSQLDQFFNNR